MGGQHMATAQRQSRTREDLVKIIVSGMISYGDAHSRAEFLLSNMEREGLRIIEADPSDDLVEEVREKISIFGVRAIAKAVIARAIAQFDSKT
jgi:hypothetical protein